MNARKFVLATAMSTGVFIAAPAMAQASDPFLGQMALFPYNFCPRGWTEASGQVMPIAENTALFSLLGTTYGGNGQTTFALPDLRGRVPIGQGQGSGLSNYDIGQVGGSENKTLNVNEMPAHTHVATGRVKVTYGAGTQADPTRANFAVNTSNNFTTAATTNNMKADNVEVIVSPAGGNQPFSIVQPYLAMRWCISLQGVFPSRN